MSRFALRTLSSMLRHQRDHVHAVTGNTVSFNRFTGIFANCPSLVAGNTAYFNGGVKLGSAGAGCAITSHAAP